MPKGRWTAIIFATALVGIGVGLLYLVLSEAITDSSAFRYFPYGALAAFAASPFVAAFVSGRGSSLAVGAGGLALGIVATVVAATLNNGGTGAMPLALGIALSGLVALGGSTQKVIGRLLACAAIGAYAFYSGRLISVLFAYPLLGLADEFADMIRKPVRPSSP